MTRPIIQTETQLKTYHANKLQDYISLYPSDHKLNQPKRQNLSNSFMIKMSVCGSVYLVIPNLSTYNIHNSQTNCCFPQNKLILHDIYTFLWKTS